MLRPFQVPRGLTKHRLPERSREGRRTIQKARDGAEGYALTLDTNTQSGRDNKDMLVDLAQQAQNAAEKQFALDGNTDAYRSTLESSRQALLDRAQQLGINADEAGALADQIFRIPSDTEWEVIAQTAAAQGVINRFITDNAGRAIPLRITAEGISSIRLPNGMTASSNARGGFYDYAFAGGGGVDTGIYQGRDEAIYKFAEKETVWESFISGKPSERERNVGIWQETGRRLGVDQAVTAQAGPVYVQNPFTGEYLLAKTSELADASAVAATSGFASTFRGGRR